MKKTVKIHRAHVRTRRNSHVASAPAASTAPWAPEPCGLSRDEMRAIVAEMLG